MCVYNISVSGLQGHLLVVYQVSFALDGAFTISCCRAMSF